MELIVFLNELDLINEELKFDGREAVVKLVNERLETNDFVCGGS